jgi:hypothetical protein
MIGGLLALAFLCGYIYLIVFFLARRAAAHDPAGTQPRAPRRRLATPKVSDPIEVVPTGAWTALDDLQVTRLLRDAAR